MDCRTCEPILIDLVHDELATDAAEEARAHLAECASCRASFERLSEARRIASQLELAEAPQRVRAHLLQLAEARAGELRLAAAPKVASSTLSRALLDFIARFATGPQVGMATIMLLIVAFGLWALPRMRPESVAGGTVINPESPGEAAPSKTGVEPAQRLDLKVDARSGRIRNRDGQPEAAPASPHAGPPAVAQAASEAVAEAAPSGAQPAADGDPLARLDDFADIVDMERAPNPEPAKRKVAEAKRAETESERVALEGAASKSVAARDEAAQANEPQPFPESAASAAPAAGALTGSGKAGYAQAPPAPARPASVRAPRPRSTRRAEEGLALNPSSRGASAERVAAQSSSGGRATAPEPAQLDDLLESAVASKPPARHSASLLAEARSTARADGCLAALPSYERVVSSAPTSADAGAALIEMALCRRDAGQLAEARRLLERAQGIPASAARARTLLSELAKPTAR